mmetsp:Transcript_55752/g.65151  ORF Transcript_55752/g.65151 Transcript_55752/m.65151 type:complete len:87 (+) Transcript_55752:441-701(+)
MIMKMDLSPKQEPIKLSGLTITLISLITNMATGIYGAERLRLPWLAAQYQTQQLYKRLFAICVQVRTLCCANQGILLLFARLINVV